METTEFTQCKIRSSKGEIEQFKESAVWLDIVDELTELIDQYRDLLIQLPSKAMKSGVGQTEILVELGRIDGTTKAFEYVKDRMLNELISDFNIEDDPVKQNEPDATELLSHGEQNG